MGRVELSWEGDPMHTRFVRAARAALSLTTPLRSATRKTWLLAAILLLLPPAAQSAVIQPDSIVSVSSQFNATTFAATNTINGSGLPAGPIDPGDAHADYATGNHWTTAFEPFPTALDTFINWGFDAPTDLGGIYVWNHRSNVISDNSGYEPTLFDLRLFDASNNLLLFLDDVALAPDTAVAQAFGFGSIVAGVSRVRFDVEALQEPSTNFTGLAEVAFETSNDLNLVPEPGSSLLLAFGLAGLAAIRHRT